MSVSYRAAALAAHLDSLHGRTSIAQGLRAGWLVAAALAAVAALVAFAAWGQYTRKAHVQGFLVPTAGIVKVYAPQAGTVVERRVGEGQTVAAGDVLIVISGGRSDAAAAAAQESAIERLGERRDSLRREQRKQADLDGLAAAAASQRMRGLEREIEQGRLQLELQQRRVDGAEKTVQRHVGLVSAHFVSEATLQQKQEELLDQRGQLASVQRGLAGLERDLDAARAELAGSGLKQSNNAASIGRQISELEQQLADARSKRTIILAAPTAGVVTTLLADVGQTADATTPLLTILPAGASLEAQLLVPTSAAGFVRPGQKVALRYPAFPYQRFGHHEGEVVRVGRSVVLPAEARLPAAVTEPVYLVSVSLPSQGVLAYGQTMNLRPGMGVDADIRIDRRRILEWLFDPVLSVAGRI